MHNNYNSSISLICPTCASDQFEYDDDLPNDERTYICGDCKEAYSYVEIMESNSEKIQETIDQIGKAVVDDARKQLQKTIKKFSR